MLFRRKKKSSRLSDGGNPLQLLYAPDGLAVSVRDLRVNGVYRRVYSTAVLPAALVPWVLDRAYAFGDVEVSLHVVPVSNRDAVNKLTRKYTEAASQYELEVVRGGHITNRPELERKMAEAENVRQAIQFGYDRMYYCCLLFAVSSPSPDELEARCQAFENLMAGAGIRVQALEYWQDRGIHHLLPLGILPPHAARWQYQNLLSGGAACLAPLTSCDTGHASGVFVGFNLETGSPVFLDLFAKEMFAPHMFVFGQTGAGKSVTLSVLVGRNIACGRRVAFLDVEGEFRVMTEKMGGLHVRLDPAAEPVFNILDLEPEWDDRKKEFYVDVPGKVREVAALFSGVLEHRGEKLGVDGETHIEEALREEYAARGITRDPESLYEPGGKKLANGTFAVGRIKKRMPTISDVVRRIEARDGRVAFLLKPFTRGGTLGFLDGETKVSVRDVPAVCFNLKPTEKDDLMRFYATQAIFLWLWEHFVKAQKDVEKVLLVDEAWVFMRHPNAVQFLLAAAKRGRKYRTSLVIATQSFRDFASEDGQNIIAQCSAAFLMRSKPEEAKLLCGTLGYSDGVRDYISSIRKRGFGVLDIMDEMAKVRVYVTPWEWSMLEKKPDEMA
ncbi:VirB4 family type IV secretion system protein [Desulfofundulus thermosubterraneus]|uniref:AAA-like domain-containing protein n=1 Tax=Desulfofundulus thermosubterraneus DSM 16057 TaxID=1121432 RepID=A0A1M6JBH1_9FIRM|nr:ATP-binding protein [Desulfofundulus thermosubterraneus]SHJ44079.1 AAA-like domain-containing protein [Desulfofundulus thermosubterraneus DSM 16057]